MRPVQGRRFDRGREGHAPSEPGKVREEAQQGHGAYGLDVGCVKREIANREQCRPGQDSRSWASVVDKDTDRYAEGVHAQISEEADQVALSRGELQPLSKLRCPSRVHILLTASVTKAIVIISNNCLAYVGAASEGNGRRRDAGDNTPIVMVGGKHYLPPDHA